MKYTTVQYAEALILALGDRTGKDRIGLLKNFLATLYKTGDKQKIGLILRAVEKLYLKKSGLRKVSLETTNEISAKVRKEIEKILGPRVFLLEKTKPELLAGIKILINDEWLVDASAETQLKKLFS